MATASTTLFFCKECLQYFLDSNAALQHSCKKEDENALAADHVTVAIEAPDELTETATEVASETYHTEVISNNPNRRGWTDKETLCLITACKKHQEKFGNPGYKMKKVWEEIARDMCKQGIQVNPEHVTNKWKSLLKAYRKTKHREARGDGKRTSFKFYEVIDKLLGTSTAVMMSLARNRVPESTTTPSVGTPTCYSDDEESDSEGNPAKKRLKKSRSMEVLLFLRDYLEEKRRDEQKRHREIMEIEKKKIELLTTICTNMNKN